MAAEEDNRSLSEKRSDAAKQRWQGHTHPLFIYEDGERAEPIGWINVRRYSVNGPVDHHRVWPAAELTSEEDIFSFFGGGTYELLGRRSMPNGQAGPIIKKRRLTLEGQSRPFVGSEQVTGAQTLGVAPGEPRSDPFAMMMAMMAEDRKERRQEDQRRQEREEARAAQTTQLMVQGLGIVGTIVTAILNRPVAPQQPMPDIAGAFKDGMQAMLAVLPKPDTTDPLDKISKVLEVAEKLKPSEKTESLPELMSGLGEAMQGFAQVEGMRIEAAKQGILGAQPPGAGQPPAEQTSQASQTPSPNGAAVRLPGSDEPANSEAAEMQS